MFCGAFILFFILFKMLPPFITHVTHTIQCAFKYSSQSIHIQSVNGPIQFLVIVFFFCVWKIWQFRTHTHVRRAHIPHVISFSQLSSFCFDLISFFFYSNSFSLLILLFGLNMSNKYFILFVDFLWISIKTNQMSCRNNLLISIV